MLFCQSVSSFADRDCRTLGLITIAATLSDFLERAYATARRRSSATTSSVAQARDAWYSQRRCYRQLRHVKSQTFWRDRIASEQTDLRRLWRSVDSLLGRGRQSASISISAEEFCQYFTEKVEAIRQSTAGSPPPTFTERQSAMLGVFSTASPDEVATVIRRLPDKSSAADPIPTSVLKSVADLLSPYVAHLFNVSTAVGQFPSSFKRAFITPIIKKAGMDAEDVKSYRPIANLPVLSKVLERLAARRLSDYIKSAGLLPSLQSGFRPLHSTETAVLKVLSDLLLAVDRGDVGVLVLLDLSAAFDTVDHDILLERLERSFGLTGTLRAWLRSYLAGRSQFVRLSSASSRLVHPSSGLPQGSVLGPLLFVLYAVDLIELIHTMGLQPHLYADDTQLYGFCRPGDATTLAERVSACVQLVASWMRSNRLQLNAAKTEVMWVASSRRQHQLPTTPTPIDGMPVVPVRSVRNLGVFLDSDLVMRTHVARIVSRCFGALRQLRLIRRSVSSATFQMLVPALVLARLDYANSVLVGLPSYLVKRLQSVINAAARLVFGLRRTEHVSDALITLHWLRVPERIQYKLAVLVFRVLHGTAPGYLGPLQRVADHPGRRNLRSASTAQLLVPSVRLSTVGPRAFAVAGPTVWNTLPHDITAIDSFPAFRRRLKTHLFNLSYPDVVM